MHSAMTVHKLRNIMAFLPPDTEVIINMAFNNYDIVATNVGKGYIELLPKLCHDRNEPDDEPLKTM